VAGFHAYLEARPATAEERARYPGVVEIATWRISGGWGPGLDVPGYGPTESIEIFREAMRAYEWSHGSVNNLTRYEA